MLAIGGFRRFGLARSRGAGAHGRGAHARNYRNKASRRMTKTRVGVAIGVAVGLVVGGTVSWASIPDGVHGRIDGCYQCVRARARVALRVIDTQNGDHCKAGEHSLEWDRSRLRWRGTWNANTVYADNDGVAYNSALYLAINASTNKPPTNTTYWALCCREARPDP